MGLSPNNGLADERRCSITMPVSKAPMQENSTASIITLIIAPSPIVRLRQIGLAHVRQIVVNWMSRAKASGCCEGTA